LNYAGLLVNRHTPRSVDYSQGSGDWLTSWKVTTTDLVGSIDVYGVSSETIGTNNRYGSLYVSNDVAVTPDVDGTNFSVYMLPVSLGTQKVVCAIRDMAGNMGYATGTVFLSIVTNSLYSIDAAGCVTNIKYAGVQYSNNRGIKWDGQYRLKEVLTNGASSETYGYDALGRRVITVSGGVTNFGASGFVGGFFIERPTGPCLGHRNERGYRS
jgi:YD repeat-containing protein